jgi:hypothetical protein
MNSISKPTADASASPFDPLRASRIALLTRFRRNRQGVATPVEIRVVDGKAYFPPGRQRQDQVNRQQPTCHVCTLYDSRRQIDPAAEPIALQLEGVEAAHAASKIDGK